MFSSQIFQVHQSGSSTYLTIPAFSATGMVEHLFPTRLGGCSPEPLGLNFSLTSTDDPANVRSNYAWAAEVLHGSAEDFVVSAQVHGTEILRVTAANRGCGVTRPRDIAGIDGLTTNEPGIILATIHADCVPIYFLDPVHKAIALAHAGWRGTAAGIASRMMERMKQEYGTDPSDLLCAIGPSIGPDCFEVRDDVRSQFASAFPAIADRIIREHPLNASEEGYRKDPKYLIDLWEANRYRLLEGGVRAENVTVTDLCTCSHADVFHSYRKTGTAGRMAAMLKLKK